MRAVAQPDELKQRPHAPGTIRAPEAEDTNPVATAGSVSAAAD